jgi:hypothetical protein
VGQAFQPAIATAQGMAEQHMGNTFGKIGGLVAWGTFLVLFGLLAVGALIGISRLFRMILGYFG